MNDQTSYSVFYKLSLRLVINETEVVNINNSDIVSLSIMNQYDSKTYPMIRLRLYPDITLLQKITKYPDALELRGSLDGGVYRVKTNETADIVSPTQSLQMGMKVYFEYKNTPTSDMDKYQDGLPKPLFCFILCFNAGRSSLLIVKLLTFVAINVSDVNTFSISDSDTTETFANSVCIK